MEKNTKKLITFILAAVLMSSNVLSSFAVENPQDTREFDRFTVISENRESIEYQTFEDGNKVNLKVIGNEVFQSINDADFILAGSFEKLNTIPTIYSIEDYYSWSTCSIFVKTGNIRIYKDSARRQRIDKNSGLKEWYISDPSLPTSPAGCRSI